MASLVCTAVLIISILVSCYCSSSTGVMHRRLRTFNNKLNSFRIDLVELDTDFHEKLNGFKVELAEMDTTIHESIDIATDSLRQELTEHFKQQIQEAKEEFRRDESVPNVVRAHIDSQVNRLKKGQQNMKRQLQRVMESLRHVQQEKDLYRDAFFKAERRMAESCYKCTTDSQLVCNVLKQDKGSVQSYSGNKLFENQHFNLTSVSEQLNSSYKEVIEASSLTLSSNTTSTAISSAPVQQKSVINKVLIAFWGVSELIQINLHDRSLTKYSLHVPDGVSSLCFIQRQQRLLVGTYDEPGRITSTSMDGDDTQTLREGVKVTGMAVDEGRELVFMTTWKPGHSISKMSTRGDNFTIIKSLSGGYSYPLGIAVNARQREVYVSSYKVGRVFSLSCDGKVLQTLVIADVLGVTFDSVRNTLYFHDWNTLKKISSDGIVSDVTSLRKKTLHASLLQQHCVLWWNVEYRVRRSG